MMDATRKAIIDGTIPESDELARNIQANIDPFSVYIPGHVWPVSDRIRLADEAAREKIRVVLVGKWPERHERMALHNFAGASGEMLARVADPLIRKGACLFVTNAIPFVLNDRPDQKTTNRFVQECRPLVFRELEKVRPHLVICMGREAALSVMGKAVPVQKKCSEITEIEIGGHRSYLMVTVHPASVLRNEKMFMFLENSMALAARMVDPNHPEPVNPKRCIVFPGLDQPRVMPMSAAPARLRELRRVSEAVALDCEWHGRNPMASEARLITLQVAPLADETTIERETTVFEFDGPNEEVVRVLMDEFRQIVGYNIKEDLFWLIASCCKRPEDYLYRLIVEEDRRRIVDLMLVQHVLDENCKRGLTALAARYGIPAYDTELKEAFKQGEEEEGFGHIPRDILYPYAARDAAVTAVIAPKLLRGITHRQLFELVEIETRASLALLVMEYFGLPFQEMSMRRIISAFKERKKELEQELKRSFGSEFNPNSLQHVCYVLFGTPGSTVPEVTASLGLQPVKYTDKGNPSTDAESLRILQDRYPEIPELAMLADYRTVAHAVRNFLSPDSKSYLARKDRDGRVRTTYWQTLETGRYSSSNPNLQNISKSAEEEYKRILGPKYPGSIRSAFRTDKYHRIVQADIVGAELCVMAWLSQDEAMIEDVRRSQLPPDHPDHMDLHTMIACESFGIFLPRISKEELAKAGKSHLRHAAKRIIFGLSYGRGAEAFQRQLLSEGVNISIDDVQKVIDRLRSKYPKVFEFFERCEKIAISKGELVNPFGRRRRFPFLNLMPPETVAHMRREARNFLIQSTVADFLSVFLFNLTRDLALLTESLKSGFPFWLARPILTIHDSVYVECLNNEEMIEAVSALIEEEARKVPIMACDPATGDPIAGPYHFAMEIKVSDSIE